MMHYVHTAADEEVHDLLRSVDSDYLDDLIVVLEERDLGISEWPEAQDEDAAFERWLAQVAVRGGKHNPVSVPRTRPSGALRHGPRG